MSALLVLLAAVVSALSGVAPLASRRRETRADRLAAALSVLASVAGLAGAVLALLGRGGPGLRIPWGLPGARLLVEVDGLSSLFLVPLFLVSAAGAVYATAYWSPARHPRTAPRLRLFYGVTTGAIAVIFVAKNALLFLAGWEVMTLGAFLMVGTEEGREGVRGAAWLYVACSHAAILALFALFLLLARMSGGSLDLVPLAAGLAGTPEGSAVFGLALAGFGLKAGLVPLHVWLPPAHAAAPSHVSALMSGVLIKTGIYGLVRVLSLFPDPPLAWGLVLLAAGAVSGVLGVAWALGQHDLKRLLAFHSIENVGIIAMGIGLGLAGRAAGQPAWALLGFAGGLLHVVNHALFKALLFLGAGSVVHATGTRELDRMGGLLRRLPRTAAAFLVGAVAICGLPPLNGLVSEFLLYVGLLRTSLAPGALAVAAAGGVASLALIGGLALACFVKAFGAVFLGEPRGIPPAAPHEPRAMTAPMALLALACAAIGLAPLLFLPLVEAAARVAFAAGRAAAGTPLPSLHAPRGAGALPSLETLAPVGAIGTANLAVLLAVAAVAALLAARTASATRRYNDNGAGVPLPTWDCGYARPTARMQYTASSFAAWSVGFFRWSLLPRTESDPPRGHFPGRASFAEHVPDAVLDRVLLPAARGASWLLTRVRVIQRGHIQLYLVYVVATLLLLLSRV